MFLLYSGDHTQTTKCNTQKTVIFIISFVHNNFICTHSILLNTHLVYCSVYYMSQFSCLPQKWISIVYELYSTFFNHTTIPYTLVHAPTVKISHGNTTQRETRVIPTLILPPPPPQPPHVISFLQGIYTYIHESNHVSTWEYSVAAIL